MRGKMLFYKLLQARSSVGERFLDTEEAKGSIPFAPTIYIKHLPFPHILIYTQLCQFRITSPDSWFCVPCKRSPTEPIFPFNAAGV